MLYALFTSQLKNIDFNIISPGSKQEVCHKWTYYICVHSLPPSLVSHPPGLRHIAFQIPNSQLMS